MMKRFPSDVYFARAEALLMDAADPSLTHNSPTRWTTQATALDDAERSMRGSMPRRQRLFRSARTCQDRCATLDSGWVDHHSSNLPGEGDNGLVVIFWTGRCGSWLTHHDPLFLGGSPGGNGGRACIGSRDGTMRVCAGGGSTDIHKCLLVSVV